MNPMPELTPMLKQLRLSGILDSLAARNRQAIETKLAYPEFLALLIQDEVARREQKSSAAASAVPDSVRKRRSKGLILTSTPALTGPLSRN